MKQQKFEEIDFRETFLAKQLEGEVDSWVKQGYNGVTQTTLELLNYWFNRDESSPERFYLCQQRAIETIIYCHEILQVETLKNLFEKVYPEALLKSKVLLDEVEEIPFPKYCLKMATGSGKTWVLAAILIWQYFNKLKESPEKSKRYSNRFLVVTPGLEVLNRLLDSFKGKRDIKTGNRDPQTSDYNKPLFMPDTPNWRGQFHLTILEPSEVRANTTPPSGAFVYLTNWQQFRMSKDEPPLWDKYTGADVEELPKGEIIVDFLLEFPDLVVMNDEAHHVHGTKTAKNEELVWRRFMRILYNRIKQKYGAKIGTFIQFDFSATPFYGSGKNKEYFSHIVYDYSLVEAMNHMLVKQLFLEERTVIGGENLEELDFRAEREDSGKRRKGEVIGLSPGQKLMIQIGKQKTEQLASEFREKKIERKPVFFVLCEDTTVANLVYEHFLTLDDECGEKYNPDKVLLIHSELSDADLVKARNSLDKIDIDDDPLRVVISVLMLREGFDKNNICVTVILRSAEADLLLEQVVGRGLRLMFSKEKYPSFWDSKLEAMQSIKTNRTPKSSLDFLFIVEHPKFREFYEQLRNEGFLITRGDTSKIRATGDLIPVELLPERIPEKNIYWPVLIYDQRSVPNLSKIDIPELQRYPGNFDQLKQYLGKLTITDVYLVDGKRVKTWKLENDYFDYNHFLSSVTKAIATESKNFLFTGKQAEIAGIVDEYVSKYLFGREIDFTVPENYRVLNFVLIFDHIVKQIRVALVKLIGEIKYEENKKGIWGKLSDVKRIMVRENYSVATEKSIYPKLGYSAFGGGFEKDFMLNTLENSAEVIAYTKLDRKHQLKIPYRDKDGIYRDYEIDFIVKISDCIYLVETKSERDINNPTVALKTRASHSWCENASKVTLPENIKQPSKWEYLIISEQLFYNNKTLSLQALIPQCQALRDKIIAQAENLLFK